MLKEFGREYSGFGVLFVDVRMRMASMNKRFIDMWRVPKELIDFQDDAAALRFASLQVKEPEDFVERSFYLYAHPDERSYDVIVLKDGRAFERWSHSQWIDGQLVGRLWMFREKVES